jgi:hypothetical protein
MAKPDGVLSSLSLHRLNLIVFPTVSPKGVPQAYIGLQAEPKLRGGVEEPGQAKSHIRGEGSFAPKDPAEAHPGDAQSRCQFLLAQAQRLQEFMPQDFSRRRGAPVSGYHGIIFNKYILNATPHRISELFPILYLNDGKIAVAQSATGGGVWLREG